MFAVIFQTENTAQTQLLKDIMGTIARAILKILKYPLYIQN